MKLDVNVLRYLSRDDFRTLTAVEMGQKNHEIVPAQLVDTIAGLKHGGAFKCLRNLLRHKLVHHDGQKYDGYRLTTLGYDFLAIRALVARGAIAGVGRQIGVGKESDVFEVSDDEGNVMALKLHRLGRTSFRAVKSKRDYTRRGGAHVSWLYLSRLAALKEFAFMKALGEAGLPVPVAHEVNRHAVLMSLVDAHPLVQVRRLANPRAVYASCMDILVRLAKLGLVHCDFNEFNLLVSEEEALTLIDFPQMVSVGHANAGELFDRDVEGVVKFFERKLGYLPEDDPALDLVRPTFEEAVGAGAGGAGSGALDEQLRASGFKREHEKELERFVLERRGGAAEGGSGEEGSGSGSESESGSEDGSEEEGSDEEGSENGSEGESEEEEGSESGSEEEGEGEGGSAGEGEAVGEKGSGSEGSGAEEDVGASRSGSDEEGDADGAAAALERRLRLEGEAAATVVARAAEERRRAARRAAMGKVSRNAAKPKNKGKRKGDSGGLGGGGGW